jgi:hypothetical protein
VNSSLDAKENDERALDFAVTCLAFLFSVILDSCIRRIVAMSQSGKCKSRSPPMRALNKKVASSEAM